MQRVHTPAGFTLVELLIVVIIVGILAAVAIPLYRGATTSAYGSEADAALGTVRSAMRLFQAQSVSGNFSGLIPKYKEGRDLKVTDIAELNLKAADLDSRYFDANAYRMPTLTPTTYVVQAIGDSSTTANKAAVAGLIRQIDQDGNLTTP